MELVAELDENSRYFTALMDDDELLEQELAYWESIGEKPPQSFRPRLKGWTPARSDMADVKDLLNIVIALLAKTGDKPQPIPRPENARERIDKQQRRRNMELLEAQLFPDR